MLLKNAPETFYGIILAVIWRVIRQYYFGVIIYTELDHPFYELSPAAASRAFNPNARPSSHLRYLNLMPQPSRLRNPAQNHLIIQYFRHPAFSYTTPCASAHPIISPHKERQSPAQNHNQNQDCRNNCRNRPFVRCYLPH